ncbi:MAG: hypothetical protein JXJ17_02860 [Anaerolineae bacterium]|nr:hypothetical protein [Anaerolineae bacterium]
MKTRFLGVGSILLVMAAMLIGGYAIFRASLLWGFVFVAASLAGFGAAIFLFCSRCPCQECCPHVILGWLASKLTDKEPRAYRLSELLAMAIPLSGALILPLFWLWQNWLLLAIYGVLMATALVMILRGVCPGCKNTNCPIRNSIVTIVE